MVKSETTIRRELRAVKIARGRLRRGDFGEESNYFGPEQLRAIEATLKWMLGHVNNVRPQRRPGLPQWVSMPSASQRPLAYVLDKEGDDANAKAGLMERRKDKRRA